MSAHESKDYLDRLFAHSGSAERKADSAALADKYGELSYIVQNDEYLLSKSGVSEQSAHLLRLAAALTSRRITDRYKFGRKYSKRSIEEYVCGLLFGLSSESVYMLLIADDGKLIGCECLGEGSVNAIGILPRRICDIAIRYSSKNVILAHNHPRGRATPSRDDIAMTASVATALRGAGINLVSHYVTVGFEAVDCMESVT